MARHGALAGGHPRGALMGIGQWLHQDLGPGAKTCSLSVLKRRKVKAGVVAWSRGVWMQGVGFQTSLPWAEQQKDVV